MEKTSRNFWRIKFFIVMLLAGILIFLWFSQFAIQGDNAIRVKLKQHNFFVIGYYPNWAKWRGQPYKYSIATVNGSLITHLIYAFLKPTESGDLINDCPEDYPALLNFKTNYPNVKILLSIGGYGDNSVAFKKLALNPVATEAFATNARVLLQKYDFDGIDLDWEYPDAQDKTGYISILKALNYELKQGSKIKRFLLTSAVPVGKNTIDEGYDVPAMNNYLDYINVMAYDFHGLWNKELGHNAPLFDSTEYNVNYIVNYWLGKGMNYKKIILGLGIYGRTFVVKDPTQTVPGSLADPYTKPLPGPYTKSVGFLSYYEIQNNGWTELWDDVAKVPYAFSGNQWVSYDNKQSLNYKMKYACLKLLPGFMIWDLSMDQLKDGLLPYVKEKANLGCPMILFKN